jgi:hypothetical protein
VDNVWALCEHRASVLHAVHLQPASELPRGVQQVDVVAAHEVLRQAHDGGGQGGLAVVVRRVLRHVARQLGHLGADR